MFCDTKCLKMESFVLAYSESADALSNKHMYGGMR